MNRKRFLRISLRTLLVLVAILCLCLGKLSIDARRQRQAVEWIVSKDGQWGYASDDAQWLKRFRYKLRGNDYFDAVTTVSLHAVPIEDLEPLKYLHSLESILVQNADLKTLHGIEGLERKRCQEPFPRSTD